MEYISIFSGHDSRMEIFGVVVLPMEGSRIETLRDALFVNKVSFTSFTTFGRKGTSTSVNFKKN